MVLQADESVTRSQLNASPDTLSRSFLQNPHTTIDTFSTQVAIIDHTITNINKRLQSLEGNTYSHNTAISNYDTSRTRKSRKNSTSALIDYTDLDHSHLIQDHNRQDMTLAIELPTPAHDPTHHDTDPPTVGVFPTSTPRR